MTYSEMFAHRKLFHYFNCQQPILISDIERFPVYNITIKNMVCRCIYLSSFHVDQFPTSENDHGAFNE